jgi:hypothetical protein
LGRRIRGSRPKGRTLEDIREGRISLQASSRLIKREEVLLQIGAAIMLLTYHSKFMTHKNLPRKESDLIGLQRLLL